MVEHIQNQEIKDQNHKYKLNNLKNIIYLSY